MYKWSFWHPSNVYSDHDKDKCSKQNWVGITINKIFKAGSHNTRIISYMQNDYNYKCLSVHFHFLRLIDIFRAWLCTEFNPVETTIKHVASWFSTETSFDRFHSSVKLWIALSFHRHGRKVHRKRSSLEGWVHNRTPTWAENGRVNWWTGEAKCVRT